MVDLYKVDSKTIQDWQNKYHFWGLDSLKKLKNYNNYHNYLKWNDQLFWNIFQVDLSLREPLESIAVLVCDGIEMKKYTPSPSTSW